MVLDDVICQLLDKALLLKGCRELEGAEPDPGVSHSAYDSPRLSLDLATAAAAMAGGISQGGVYTTAVSRSRQCRSGAAEHWGSLTKRLCV